MPGNCTSCNSAKVVLVPFALWNRTSFLAERVLGHIVGSGIKVMVLAVIVGIGSNYFATFTDALAGQEPDIGQAMSLMLAALALFGLGIFGPTVASGLITGGPQLGAGAAMGAVVGAGSVTAVSGIGAIGAARVMTAGAMSAIRAGATISSAATTAYGLGRDLSPEAPISGGLKGVAQAASGIARQQVGAKLGLQEAMASGRATVWSTFANGEDGPGLAADAASGTPPWAQSLRRQQTVRHYRHLAAQAMGAGDHGGAGITPDISEKDE